MKTETEDSLRSSVNHERRRRKNSYVLVWTMKTETEDSLRSSVNHGRRRKNPYVLVWTMDGDGRILTF